MQQQKSDEPHFTKNIVRPHLESCLRVGSYLARNSLLRAESKNGEGGGVMCRNLNMVIQFPTISAAMISSVLLLIDSNTLKSDSSVTCGHQIFKYYIVYLLGRLRIVIRKFVFVGLELVNIYFLLQNHSFLTFLPIYFFTQFPMDGIASKPCIIQLASFSLFLWCFFKQNF